MQCVGFLSFFFLMMHAFVSSDPQPPMFHQVGFLEAVALGRGSCSVPRVVLQAPKERQSFISVLCRVTQDRPVFGETVLFWRDAGKHSPPQGWVTACRVQGCHRPLPVGLRPHRSPALGRCGVVLTGAALWYLKRGYPLYVHFINGEYTGGDSYLRIKL